MAKRKKKPAAVSRYEKAFKQRLKDARSSAGYNQGDFAAALGLEEKTYAKYESRSMIPIHLLPLVCELTGHDPWFLLTGQPADKKPRSGPLKKPDAA